MILVLSIKLHDRRSLIDYFREYPCVDVLRIIDQLCRLGRVVIQDFTKLKVDSQAKNIAAWTPVVAETMQGFVKFDDKAVSQSLHGSFGHSVNLLAIIAVLAVHAHRISTSDRAAFTRYGS